MPRGKELMGVELENGDSLEQLGVRIAASTIDDVKRIAKKEKRTIASCVDWLLRDAVYWWRKETETK